MYETSHSIPRVGPGAGPRVLRIRGDVALLRMIRPATSDSAGATFEVPSRASVQPGDPINVEVSFGPLADEVMLRGVVHRIVSREPGQAPILVIPVVRVHAHRIDYIQKVVNGLRIATARGHRRVATEIKARWWWGMTPHAVNITELSRGGTFITTPQLPNTGFIFDLEMRLDSRTTPLRLPSRVVWTQSTHDNAGFGVNFRITDILVANRLASLIRNQEQQALSGRPA